MLGKSRRLHYCCRVRNSASRRHPCWFIIRHSTVPYESSGRFGRSGPGWIQIELGHGRPHFVPNILIISAAAAFAAAQGKRG